MENANSNSNETTFDRMVTAELKRSFPHLTSDFVELHKEQLMFMLAKRASEPQDSIGPGPAALPSVGERLDSEQSDQPGQSVVYINESQERLLKLLDYYRAEVLSGAPITNLCVMSTRQNDANGLPRMGIVFTTPINLYAYLGLMLAAVTKIGPEYTVE